VFFWAQKGNEKDMKVKIKLIGIPKPPPGFESQKEIPMDCARNSVGDLLQQISSGMDMETRGIFLTERGEISSDLAIIVNGIAISYSARFNFQLKEGDLIELVSSPG
jgi:sulfur carrier protein ThiS